MDSWLLVLIVSMVWLGIMACIVGAVVIVASNRNAKLRKELKENQKVISHQEQLINAYGIKEIHIGGNEQ